MNAFKPGKTSWQDAVGGEFTRILISYWDLVGNPPLNEFVSMIPIHDALEKIEMINKECCHTVMLRKMH